ncbi:MAG: hypothetical protein GY800_03755 [Planctomycetes bacterium]|nr:hypothetical protein [Planctomycetota bacterium]
MQKLADDVCERYGKPKLRLRFTGAQRGSGNHRTGWCSVPDWALEQGEHYPVAYVLHELVHAAFAIQGHGQRFRTRERLLLAEYGLRPKYTKAYVWELYDRDTQELLWRRKTALPPLIVPVFKLVL